MREELFEANKSVECEAPAGVSIDATYLDAFGDADRRAAGEFAAKTS